jgi:hypothetical protein
VFLVVVFELIDLVAWNSNIHTADELNSVIREFEVEGADVEFFVVA